MQASGGQQHQRRDDHGHQHISESMSRNGSGNGGAAAASPASSSAGASSEQRSQSTDGSTNAAAPRLKIRLGSSMLGGGGSNRATSTSSEGTNGQNTPRATTPVVAGVNGHSDHHDQHDQQQQQQQQNGNPGKGTNAHAVKKEEDHANTMSALPMAKSGSDSQDESKTHQHQQQQQHAELNAIKLAGGEIHKPVEEEDEESKKRREEQLRLDMAELPNVARQNLVPLYELVRRLVARSYTDLQNIVEVLPSQSDFDRKRTIIEYVITTRRQIVKLLVLLRWAKENTQDTERSINLIAFLQRQNYQLERAVQALQGVEGLLSGARVRNYDLITAVEVLTTGTYSQLPTLFRDSFIPPPKLSNEAVVALLQDLESVIRLRLQLHEHIPVQLLRRPYHIHDGRVTFHCPGYFKAAYTLGGDSPTDQWYLVDFSFDFKGRDVQAHPSGAMREHILQVCNTRLSECAAKEKEEREKCKKAGTAYEQKGSAFVSTFGILQDLCLNYQMELLHYHAIQTNNTPTLWQGMLATSLSNDRRTLEIKNQALNKAPLPPPHYGPDLRYEELLTISVMETVPSQETKPISRRLVQLAEKFAAISTEEAPRDDGTAKTTVPTLDLAFKNAETVATPKDKVLSCTFSREPMFIDSKGKKVPPPIQRRVDMRKVEYPVSLLDDAAGKTSIRDIELVTGQCFSLKASMIPHSQQP